MKAKKKKEQPFSVGYQNFWASVSVCFPAVSWSISRCHALGGISSPLAFSSFRYRAAAS